MSRSLRLATTLGCVATILGAAGLIWLGLAGLDDSTIAQPQRAIIVFDASGSMQETIDGQPKLDIAKKVIRELLRTLPEIQLGLVAYGHRRERDCSDIEMLIPPGPVDREAFYETVDRLQAVGATPNNTGKVYLLYGIICVFITPSCTPA
ncbi:MAG: VWA domain-containing protein, partial [Planctomycetaceae bacterium]